MSDDTITQVTLHERRRRDGAAAVVRRLSRPGTLIGIILMLIVVIMAIIALLHLTPYNPAAQDPALSLKPPSAQHWFGTDQFGRDVFSRVAAGLANSLRVAIVSVALAALVGTFIGLVGGFYQGVVDRIAGFITNVLFAFPSLLLALALAATLARSWETVAISIAVVYIPIFARVTRGPVLTLRNADYVLAAKAMGQRPSATVMRHIMPNITGILIVQITLSLSWAILTEASLSFLGFGTPPPAPSLGAMVLDAQTVSSVAPWMLIFPGIAVVIAVVGLNLLGDMLGSIRERRGAR